MTPRTLHTGLAALVLFAIAPAAHALDCTWISNTVGSWETAANWDCNVVPDGDDDVTITSGTVTVNADHTVSSFTFRNGTVDGAFE